MCALFVAEYESSTSKIVQQTQDSATATHTPPSGQVVCAFLDGGIGLYDLSKRKWIFLRDQVIYCNLGVVFEAN